MGHLADLQAAGHLLAAGPLRGEILRGLSILNLEPELARELKEQDAAVRAGLYSVEVVPWLVPGGLISFGATRLPRSAAEVAEP